MANCLTQLQSMAWPVFQGSARNIGELGNYNKCLDTEGLTYNLIKFAIIDTNVDSGYYMGFCLPSVCDRKIIQATLDTLLATYKYPLEVYQINNQTQNFQWPYDWTFYVTITFLISMLSLVVYSTLKFKFKYSEESANPKLITKVFCIQQNLPVITNRNPKSSLNVFNGVRSISMMWVVVGHCFSSMINGAINIQTTQSHYLLKPIFLFVDAGLFSVDVFFYVGGFLVAFVLLRNKPKTNAEYLIAILQRAMRLWPSYLVAIMIFYALYEHTGSGPIWGNDEPIIRRCEHFWQSIIFIDNLVDNGKSECLGWGWYLQNDMQLFVISMIIMLIYSKNKLIAKVTASILIIASLIFTFVYCQQNNVHTIARLVDTTSGGTFFQDVYLKPWARCPPYLFGLLYGMAYSQYIVVKKQQQKSGQQQEQISDNYFFKLSAKLPSKKVFRLAIELSGLAIMFFTIMIPRTLQVNIQWPQFCHSLYLALGRFLFVTGLSLTVLPSILGYRNSFVSTLLDTNFFNFVAKISFCTYLLHLMVILHWNGSRKYDHYYSLLDTLVIFSGMLTISLILGFIMTIVIELPFSNLQKMLINRLKQARTQKQPNMENEAEKSLLVKTQQNVAIN